MRGRQHIIVLSTLYIRLVRVQKWLKLRQELFRGQSPLWPAITRWSLYVWWWMHPFLIITLNINGYDKACTQLAKAFHCERKNVKMNTLPGCADRIKGGFQVYVNMVDKSWALGWALAYCDIIFLWNLTFGHNLILLLSAITQSKHVQNVSTYALQWKI